MLNKKALAATAAGEAIYIEDVFSTYLYTGAATNQTITNGIDLATEGGLVWVKCRSTTKSHVFCDTERGVSKALASNTTDAQDDSPGNYVRAFNSDGFGVGAAGDVNGSGATFGTWTFRKAEKFFDVVTYTGNGTAGRTVSHNLGSVPGCIIVKRTDSANGWPVYHRAMDSTSPQNYQMRLNATTERFTTSPVSRWNNAAPTSTTFTLSDNDEVNGSGATYVAYLFAHDAGGFGDSGSESVIKCGSYTGNDTSQSITLGYEPQWILAKPSSQAGDWYIFDNMRGIATGSAEATLFANDSAAELNVVNALSLTATGFDLPSASFNNNGVTYIYIAIRRGPMKTPETGSSVFEPFVDRTSIANKTNGTMGPVDMTMQTQVSDPLAGYHWTTFDRLRGANKYILTASTAAEATDTSVSFDVMGGVKNATWFSSGGVGYNFKRAPGFFDVVCYTGTGSARTVTHNLGVVPELMIVKRRSAAEEWPVYVSALGNDNQMFLNATSGSSAASYWNNTTPTSTVFSVGTSNTVNANGSTYVAYLFATLAGVSKVGSYTGTGNLLQVNCGFTSSARFVLIKRTDTTGDWYVWDSARGIVSGNDPYLLMNSTASEVTNTDYIDTYSSGFEVTAAASTTVNVTGGTYIFLAIA